MEDNFEESENNSIEHFSDSENYQENRDDFSENFESSENFFKESEFNENLFNSLKFDENDNSNIENPNDGNYYITGGTTTLESEKKRSKYYTSGSVFTFLAIFAVVFTSVVYIFNYVLHPIRVVGTSMQPTINSSAYYEGDSDETHCDIVYYRAESSYSNNDIVIVENTNSKYVPDESITSVIKRVIATPHQTVRFYYVRKELANYNSSEFSPYYKYYYNIEVYDENGENINLDQSYLDAEMYFTEQQLIYYSNTSYSSYQLFAEIFTSVLLDDNQEYFYEVSENCYFVMGDNRNNSTDSRFFGEVSYDDISGKVQLIVAYNSNLLETIWIKIKSYFSYTILQF